MAKRKVLLNFTSEMWSDQIAISTPTQFIETKITK